MRGRLPGVGRGSGARGERGRRRRGARPPVGRRHPDAPGGPAPRRGARGRAPASRPHPRARARRSDRHGRGGDHARRPPGARWGRGDSGCPSTRRRRASRRSAASSRPTPPGPGGRATAPRGTWSSASGSWRPTASSCAAGGKVVKNVAGYDLAKLYIGSLGTLGIIVDATLKLRPRPESEGACWATFPALDAAARAAAALAGSELGPVAAGAPGCPRRRGVRAPRGARRRRRPGRAGRVRRPPERRGRRARGRRRGAPRRRGRGRRHRSTRPPPLRALGAVREARRLVASPLAVATAGVLPADVGAYLETAGGGRPRGRDPARRRRARGPRARHADPHRGRGGGPARGRDRRRPRRSAARPPGRAAATSRSTGPRSAVREACPVWDPPGPAGALMRGIKARLDPAGVLNPGRFVGGI